VFVDFTVDGSSRPELRIDGYLAGRRVASVRMSADTSRDCIALTAAIRLTVMPLTHRRRLAP
jgi:hypothetical protein